MSHESGFTFSLLEAAFLGWSSIPNASMGLDHIRSFIIGMAVNGPYSTRSIHIMGPIL